MASYRPQIFSIENMGYRKVSEESIFSARLSNRQKEPFSDQS
jgi:hypothetical protein